MLILDGEDIRWIKDFDDQGRILDDNSWMTYIVGYRRTGKTVAGLWSGKISENEPYG